MNKYILTLSCRDRIGIVAAISSHLNENNCFIIESGQFGDKETNKFFMRTVFSAENFCKNKFAEIAQKFQMDWDISNKDHKPKLLIAVSKQSHCLNYLLHRHMIGALNVEIPAIISNHKDLEFIAGCFNIPFYHLPMDDKKKQEADFYKLIKENEIDLVVLARYMQILSPELTKKLEKKAINIHHSFLPSFKGAKPYHQAYERGVKIIGATAHYVTNELDEGPIIDQEVARVDHARDPKEMIELGYDLESLVLYRAIKSHIEKRILINNNKTVVF